MFRAALRSAGLGVLLLAATSLVWADNWTQFRGNQSGGVTESSPLPAEWDKDKNIQWKVKLPGYGWSQPVVWGDKVFVTTAVTDKQAKPSSGFGGGFGKGGFGKGGFGKGGFGGRPPDQVYQFQVLCLNAADGKVIWKQTAVEQKPTIPTHGSNTYATETPATDGERVYAYFGMTGVFCYDFAGKQVWKADLGSYRMSAGFGTGSSPVLADGRLVIQCDNEDKSFLVALDAKSGKELWRTPRTEGTSWSTPLVWKNKMRTEIVCLGSPKARSYDPATGKQLWELGGLIGQPQASMAASDELLYLGTGGLPSFGGFGGFGGGRGSGAKPLFAVKAGAAGDISKSESVAWQEPQAGPAMASPILHDGLLYILDQRSGLLSCHDAKTGKQVYRERLSGARGFTSSPVAGDGKLYCLDDSGQVFVVQLGAEFKLLGRNPFNEMAWSSPVVANGALLVRTVDHLYCIRQATK